MDCLKRETGPERGKWRDSSADSSRTACPPQPHHTRLAKQPHDTASHPAKEERHDSDAFQSRAAQGKDKNKNQDYKAAATTTAGTAAARARLCAEPRAQVSKAIAPAWCAAASSIGTT